MKTHIEIDERTMRGVLWRKVIDAVDCMSLRQMGIAALLTCLAATYTSFLLDDGRTLLRVTEWRGGVLPTIVFANACVFSLPAACRWIRDAWNALPAREEIDEPQEGTETLDGVSTSNLLTHLFRNRTFKRVEVESKFGLPRHRYSTMADALEQIGILTRGENNARVLDPEMTIDRAAELLAGKRRSEDLEIPINIVRPLPSPAPIFVRRSVAQTA